MNDNAPDSVVYLGPRPCVPFLNTCGPFLYFVVIFGVSYWGITEALPILYTDHEGWLLFASQAIGWFLAFEIMINWFCVRYVDSSYDPALHGGKPRSPPSQKTLSRKADDNYEMEKSIQNGTTKRKKIYKMFVATSIPDDEGYVKKESFNYWSWTPCVLCRFPRPPRCHHCVLCQKCVLKRDHHCFFAGSCVGVNNQRHFIVFSFWTLVGCGYAFLHMVPYVFIEIFPKVSIIDFIPPVTFVRAVFGYQTFLLTFLVMLGWCLMIFIAFSAFHLVDSFVMVINSQTTFEQSNNMDIIDTRTIPERLCAVFGDYWLLNFVFPCHWLFKPKENPLLWPTVYQE